jgi:predicted xylose isomerase-like sugar epimerase
MAAKSRAEAMKAVEAIFERYDDDFLVQSLGYSICSFPRFSVLF